MRSRCAAAVLVANTLLAARGAAFATPCTGHPDGTACDDQNQCSSNDVCCGGQCMAGNPGTFVQAPGSPIAAPHGPGATVVADFNLDG